MKKDEDMDMKKLMTTILATSLLTLAGCSSSKTNDGAKATADSADNAKNLIDYITGKEGQQIVKDNKLITID